MLPERTLPKEIIEAFSKIDVPNISDAMDRLGIYGALSRIKAVIPHSRMCGQAFTVHFAPSGIIKGTVGDYFDDILPGEVAVLDNNGREDCAVWGDIVSIYAARRGIAGTLIDGVCRDIQILRERNYPVFSKGTYMVSGRDRVYADRVGVTVSIAGIQVNPGDLICGDGNGAVVVPFERAEEVLKTALEIEAAEKEIIERLNAGMSFLEASRQT